MALQKVTVYKKFENNVMYKNKIYTPILSLLILMVLSHSSQANYNVQQLTKDPKNWAIWGGTMLPLDTVN